MTNLVREHNPQVVFLMEIKRKLNEMDWLRSKWRFDKCLIVDGIGRGGGLALLWINKAKVKVKSFSRHHINVIIREENEATKWHFISFYGEPDTSKHM